VVEFNVIRRKLAVIGDVHHQQFAKATLVRSIHFMSNMRGRIYTRGEILYLAFQPKQALATGKADIKYVLIRVGELKYP
jgi:hypothetical protein